MAFKNKCKRCNSTESVKCRDIKCTFPGIKIKVTLKTFHCPKCFIDIVNETENAGYENISYSMVD